MKNIFLNKISITDEVLNYFNILDDSKFDNANQFLKSLKSYYKGFNITLNDIKLMEYVILAMFNQNVKNNYEYLEDFLKIEKENKNDIAYYESQLKFCNFYIDYSGEKCDKKRVIDIFDKLI